MSQFELNKHLKKDYNLRNLWKMIQLCHDIHSQNGEEKYLIILDALTRLAELRDGEAVDADLAKYQDSCLRELALKTLVGNKSAMKQLKNIKFTHK